MKKKLANSQGIHKITQHPNIDAKEPNGAQL